MHRLIAFVSAGLLLTMFACVGDDAATAPIVPLDGGSSSGDDGSVLGDGGMVPTLTVSPASARVRRGETVDVTVSVTRNGFDGIIIVSANDRPAGVSTSYATIAPGATSTTLTLTAGPAALQGRAALKVQAPGFADVPLDLLVAGAPATLDPSFDNDGFVLGAASAANALYYGLAVQPDRKVLAVGTQDVSGGTWIIHRFNEDGSPDTAFNTAAALSVPTTGAARAVVLDPTSNRVVVVGQSNTRLSIVRRNANGTPDESFGNGGTYVVDSVTHSMGSIGYAAVVLADASILVAGSRNATPLGIVEKVSATGVRVTAPTFIPYEMPNDGTLNGLFAAANGTFMATGTNKIPAPQNHVVVRLLANGTPDAAFASGGLRNYAADCLALGAALAKNGDVILAGQNINGPVPCQTRVAASTSGALGFTANTSVGTSDRFTSAAGAPDSDATYVAGYGGGSMDRYAMIERRTLAGALDSTFGTGGRLLFEDPLTADTYRFELYAATTMADGRIVVAGKRQTLTPAAATQLAIIRVWQ